MALVQCLDAIVGAVGTPLGAAASDGDLQLPGLAHVVGIAEQVAVRERQRIEVFDQGREIGSGQAVLVPQPDPGDDLSDGRVFDALEVGYQ